MTIEEILAHGGEPGSVIAALKEKAIFVPSWGGGKKGLAAEYDPKLHPVMDKAAYPDNVTGEGRLIPVTRVPLDFQRLAVKRMSELVCGIPVKREYKPENDTQQELAGYIEAVYDRNRIDSVNTERCAMLFAGCEVMTLWYAVEAQHSTYGFDSPLKFRCRNFTPMLGDELYPLFDEYGDMTAMSVGYTRKVGRKFVKYFDCYTATKHFKWSTETGDWNEVENEDITVGKIPAIYMWRPTPIWEQTSHIVYEMEWALSRNGNYIRENSKPLLYLAADEAISYGEEGDPNREFRGVVQVPKGGSLQYATWTQAVENLKFHIEQLRSVFFTLLQLPDWSYEKMSQQALSGESRKQMFIDAQLKVKDESGRLIEFFDREMNVVKAFMKSVLPERYAAELDALKVDMKITPFTIGDEAETINNLLNANGGLPVISQRESIEMFGHTDNVDKTLEEIQAQDSSKMDIFRQNPAR